MKEITLTAAQATATLAALDLLIGQHTTAEANAYGWTALRTQIAASLAADEWADYTASLAATLAQIAA